MPHAAHPSPLREQAFALHCEGLRSPAISQELGVPERTIRAWIASTLDDLKDDLQLNRKEQLLLAVERQHQLTATAWQQFHHEAAARDALLDAALDTLHAATDSSSSGVLTNSASIRLPASTPAPRYLGLIIQANKEVNRLLGLYTLAKLLLLNPDAPDMPASTLAPLPDPAIPAESATTFAISEIAAKMATASPVKSDIPAESATAGAGLAAGIQPANLDDTRIPAESATATPSCSSLPFVSSMLNPRSPAKSATAADLGLAAGTRTPANPHPTIPSPSVASSRLAAPLSPQGEGPGVRSPAKRQPARKPQPWMM